MTTSTFSALGPVTPTECALGASTAPGVVYDGSWRYARARMSRPMIVVAALLSAGLHSALFFGFSRAPAKAPPKPEHVIALTLAIPSLKDLEEPEPLATDDAVSTTDLATLVPMQADLPQIPQPNDFVQAINFASLLEKPDLSNVSISIIPDTFRSGKKIAESIGKIFNLADLDRVPESIIQPSPFYPMMLKRDGITGTVRVEFVVDTSGRVLDAQVVETSHSGFNDAAIAAVSKWKFRPGTKDGRKVNTRMGVPIVFSLTDAVE